MNLLSERLAYIYSQHPELEGDRGQTGLVRISGASKSVVNQWLNGSIKSINILHALEIEANIGISHIWLMTGLGDPYPSKYEGQHGFATLPFDEKRELPRVLPFNRSMVTAYDQDDGVPDDVVLVPESKIKFAAGDGNINYELIEDEEPATYRRSWFQKYGINPDHVRRFRVTGDSMEPLLFTRDTILVNLDETQVVDGRLYAIRYGDQLRVKYLSKRLDGTLVLRSVNPAYKDEEVSAELANEHITVIGRVRDRSGTGGL